MLSTVPRSFLSYFLATAVRTSKYGLTQQALASLSRRCVRGSPSADHIKKRILAAAPIDFRLSVSPSIRPVESHSGDTALVFANGPARLTASQQISVTRASTR